MLCSILASSGSTPRGAGAKMAVFADGHTEGTVGGGAVELESGKLAMEVLKTKQSLVHGYCLALNEVADIGMICGGNVTVFFQYFDPQAEADTALLRGILELLNGNQNSWLVYRMDDGCVSAMGTYDEAHGLRFTDCITLGELRPMLLCGCGHEKRVNRAIMSSRSRGRAMRISSAAAMSARHSCRCWLRSISALWSMTTGRDLPRRSTIRRLSASFSAIIWTLARI